MRQVFFGVLLTVVYNTSDVHAIELKGQVSVDIAHGNKAIKNWIECAKRDERFLLYDQSSQILSLRHGKAVLRKCLIGFESLGVMPKEKTFLLLKKIRLSFIYTRRSILHERNIIEGLAISPNFMLLFHSIRYLTHI